MRSRTLVGLAGLMLAGLALAGGMAATAAPPASSPAARTITLDARSQLEHAQGVDAAPSGRSAGDRLVFSEKLLNRGRVIGHDAADCVALFDQRSSCTGTYRLRGGQLMVQLIQPHLGGTVTYSQAITGGTGRFAGAGGTITVRQNPSGDRFTFHIQAPRG